MYTGRMTHVCVLSGGKSDERAVSLRSGAAVAAALGAAGYRVTTIDSEHCIDDLLTHLDTLHDIDVVFPVLHGIEGESGVLQKLLEDREIPFVGSGSAASELCFYKDKYRDYVKTHGTPIATGEIIGSLTESSLASRPFVLKPYDSGSSVDTFIVRDVTQAPLDKINEALARRKRMLIEELIEGIEITLSVLNGRALTPVEIIPPDNEEFDYENKYNGKTQELCPPQHVDKVVLDNAKQLTEKIHNLLGCRDYSRTDMIVRPNGDIVVLETNTLPGMTDQSLFPKAAAASGYPMPELVKVMVETALARH
jgi:D-alanine-D-alanine ligase